MSDLTWMIGNVRITSLLGAEGRLPIRAIIPKATAENLSQHMNWLSPSFIDSKGYCTLATRIFVIVSSGKKIIVDTGWGEHKIPGYERLSGFKSFLDDLSRAGFPRESIDVVLCTHMHVDHVGQHTIQSGSSWIPTFPNARYLFVKKEWEYWSNATNRLFSENFNETVRPVMASGLADLVEANHQVTEEVRLEPTPGHTPGHVSIHVTSGSCDAVILGDVTHHPVQWAKPDWGIYADSDNFMAVQTRERMRAKYVNTETLLIGTHYPSYCSGYLVSEDKYTTFREKRAF